LKHFGRDFLSGELFLKSSYLLGGRLIKVPNEFGILGELGVSLKGGVRGKKR